MNRSTTKPTKWLVRPAQAQISLGICPVWAVLIARLKKLNVQRTAKNLIKQQIWVFAERTCHFVGFVVLRLYYVSYGQTKGTRKQSCFCSSRKKETTDTTEQLMICTGEYSLQTMFMYM